MKNLESEFDNCVVSINGKRVTELFERQPDFPAADYIFEDHQVIAELKCLYDDKIRDPKISKKASDIYLKYLSRNEVPIKVFGTVTISTENFSKEFQSEISELYRVPIQTVIKKANKQIKSTKSALGADNYHGLLLIINNSHSALTPANAMWLISETFRRYTFSAIDSIIYTTCGVYSSHPDIHEDCLVWVPSSKTQKNPCPQKLSNDLMLSWFSRLADIKGQPIKRVTMDNIDDINKMRNIE